ncbi:MAG: ABC transporter ATP-binding protein, partial [Bacteroidales bacterium]|nr:ABC transporter ATP-binding protein [Bacteroidales bacterium]
MNRKQKHGVARLLEIAGQKKILLIVSSVFSVFSAVMMLVPYFAVYKILEELLKNFNHIGNINTSFLQSWAWIALLGLAGGLLSLYLSLILSHIAAFNILYGLRMTISEHIAKLPLGFITSTSTGAVKKTMEQNVEKAETFIAHTIPDIVNVIATIAVMFAVFFTLNGWLATVCCLVIAASLYLQFSVFYGKKATELVKSYYDTQESLSASAVEYVSGMQVIKIFSQSLNSFKNFAKQINEYKTFALKICNLYEKPMIRFTVGLNSVVAFILPVGIVLFDRSASSVSFAAVWLFFIIMSPGLASPVYKLMYLGSSTKEIDEGVQRIDNILNQKPLPEPSNPKIPGSYDIKFFQVYFSYDSNAGKDNCVLKDINFTAQNGKITALVGASGSGKSTLASLIARFYDVNAGVISIGNVNIKDIASSELMNLVAFVFQDTFLLRDTVAKNINP